MSQYEALMAELDTLAKSMEASADTDAKIGDAAGNANPDDDADGDGDGDEDDEGGEFGKSLLVTDAAGNQHQAIDGMAMIKSLVERLDNSETSVTKVLENTVALIGRQSDMIKSLGERLDALSGAGRGRKSTLTTHEKPPVGTMAKSHGEGNAMSADVFFTKALAAQREGRMSGIEISTAESCLNRGQPIPAHILAKVSG